MCILWLLVLKIIPLKITHVVVGFGKNFSFIHAPPHPLVLRLLSSFQCLINMRKVSRNIIMGVFL